MKMKNYSNFEETDSEEVNKSLVNLYYIYSMHNVHTAYIARISPALIMTMKKKECT